MTKREKGLLGGLGAMFGVGIIAFVGITMVVLPWRDKDKQINARQREIGLLEDDITAIQAAKRKFETQRQQSLPGDVSMSRREYANMLENLCRRADFAAGTYKITPLEPDFKSSPTIAPKKPAYTKLTFDMSIKGELYHFVDFMQNFYQQPLLHAIKKINVQRLSEARAQGRKELDVNLTIEALVLDSAPTRPTLLPISREMAMLGSPAALTGFTLTAASTGRGSATPPTGVSADDNREYLAIAGKNVFFGPPPKEPTPKGQVVEDPDDDISGFIQLQTLVGGYEDGRVVAVFRDKLNNTEYTATETAKGNIIVKGEYELNGRKRLIPGYSFERPSRDIMYGTEEGQNRRVWRVRKVTVSGVVLEKMDTKETLEKPKLPAIAALGGGFGLFTVLPEGKMYRANLGQSLDAPTKYLLMKDAWKDVYGVQGTVPVSEGR